LKIAVIGSGYVGLTAAVGFARSGHQVVCIDIDTKRVEMLMAGECPIFEEGLEQELKAGLKAGSLFFATHTDGLLSDVQVVFVTVGTPGNADGSVHLNSVQEVVKNIAKVLRRDQLVVIKSTVPVGTCNTLKQALPHLEIVSNPEFLREGMALQDFLFPQRVIVGTDSQSAAQILKEIYNPIVRDSQKFLVMDPSSAEMSKYAANAMLAARISFMNEMSQLCEKFGADIQLVHQGIGSDSRIGMEFLNAGVGFGGSCLPKDINALIDLGASHGVELPMIHGIRLTNQRQKTFFAHKVMKSIENLNSVQIGIWGLSFKPQTDDIRESPALEIIEYFLQQGLHVRVFDPVAMSAVQQNFKFAGQITFAADPLSAAQNCDVLCIMTEWVEFTDIDLQDLKLSMKTPRVFDGRNIFDPVVMKKHGIEYHGIGRSL
ncbi:MAG TPA: UDP-glucose/GDP-mannose dehydrogenase family protein, partial [Bdellovibrio sp.]